MLLPPASLTCRQLRSNTAHKLLCDAQLIPWAACRQVNPTATSSSAPSTSPAWWRCTIRSTPVGRCPAVHTRPCDWSASAGWGRGRAEHACWHPAGAGLSIVAIVGCVLLEEAVAGCLGCVCIIKQPPWLSTLQTATRKQRQSMRPSWLLLFCRHLSEQPLTLHRPVADHLANPLPSANLPCGNTGRPKHAWSSTALH